MTGKKEPSIPASLFMEWHNEKAREVDARKSVLDKLPNYQDGHGLSLDAVGKLQFDLGEVAGRESLLKDFAGFLVAHSTDMDQTIQALLAES